MEEYCQDDTADDEESNDHALLDVVQLSSFSAFTIWGFNFPRGFFGVWIMMFDEREITTGGGGVVAPVNAAHEDFLRRYGCRRLRPTQKYAELPTPTPLPIKLK